MTRPRLIWPPSSARWPIGSASNIPWSPLALLALAFWLRLTIFAETELGLDGLLSVGIARLSWPEILDFSLRDVHPPLYYLLLSVWLGVIGPGFLPARWPSIAAGVIALAVFFHLLRRIDQRRLPAAGLWLLAVSPAGVFLGATVRDFALGVLLSLLSWLAFERCRRSGSAGPAWPWWIALTAITAGALLTWYFHLLVWGTQAVAALFLFGKARPGRIAGSRGSLIAALLLGGLIALPWYAVFIRRLTGPGGGFGASGTAPANVELGLFLNAAGRALVGDPLSSADAGWLFPVWPAALLLGAWLIRRRIGSKLAALLAAGALAGVGATWILFRFWVGGDFLYRYFLVSAFYGGVLVAGAFAAIRHPGIHQGMLALAGVPALIFYGHFVELHTDEGQRAEFQRWIAPRLVRDDLVVFDDLADLGYFSLANRTAAGSMAYHTQGATFLRDRTVGGVLGATDRAVAAGRTIWRVRQAGPESRQRLELDEALLDRSRPVRRDDVAGRSVLAYQGRAGWQPADGPPIFGGSLALDAFELPEQVSPGSSLPVALRWQARAPIDRDYVVFVHILGPTGQRVAQHDAAPAGGTRPTTTWSAGGAPVVDLHWIDLPPNLPPGRYQVVVGLYLDQTRPALPNGATVFTIGSIEVRP